MKGLKDFVPWQVESYVEYTIAEGGRAGDTVQVQIENLKGLQHEIKLKYFDKNG